MIFRFVVSLPIGILSEHLSPLRLLCWLSVCYFNAHISHCSDSYMKDQENITENIDIADAPRYQ